MWRAHTVDQIRTAEAESMARLPESALMQRAATGLANAVTDRLRETHGRAYGRRVVLLVGSGDNGGDALYAGALLARRGVDVGAVLLSERTHPGGVAALRAAGGRVAGAAEPPPATLPDLVIDGIVGIGGRPGLRPDAQQCLARYPGVPIVAVDVPSGVDVDTGETPLPHVRADLTVTFGTHKIAQLADPAAAACGTVRLVDIGLSLPEPAVTALTAADVARLVPVPDPSAHKYTRGVVGIRAGSRRYPGAAVLSVAGAASGLAGMVRYVGDASDAVRGAHPEVVGDGRVQSWVVGSGTDTDAEALLEAALADGVPLVVDADAIALADRLRGHDAVLTPHAGELAALLRETRDEVESRPLHHAREAAARYDTVVLLKGRRTIIATPDGRARVTIAGTPWLATAGAGDVLGGLIGALAAAGLSTYDAAAVGSWLHGAAAERASGGGPTTAGEVARAIPAVVAGLLRR